MNLFVFPEEDTEPKSVKELGLTHSWLSPHLCLNRSLDLLQYAALYCIAAFFLGGNILKSAALKL